MDCVSGQKPQEWTLFRQLLRSSLVQNGLSHQGAQKGAYLNTGSGWKSAPEYTPPFLIFYDKVGDVGARFTDLNGDGLVDMVCHRAYEGGAWKGAYLNTGSGWRSAPEYTPPYRISTDRRGEAGVRFMDVNGDGLVDMIYNRSVFAMFDLNLQKGAYLNTGKGWKYDESYVPSTWLASDYGGDAGAKFVDVNSDGLIDMLYNFGNVWSRSTGAYHHKGAYINTGSGWRHNENLVPPVLTSVHGRDPGVKLMDLNGDALPDMLYHQRGRARGAYLNTGKKLLIKEIKGSRTISIEYKTLVDGGLHAKSADSEFPVVDLQIPKYVVAKTKISNGVGGNNTTSYKYAGLKAHVQGRGLLGFEKIEKTKVERGQTTIREFYQGFPLTGELKQVKKYVGGKLLNQTDFERQTRDGAKPKIKRVWLSKKTEVVNALNGASSTTTETFYKNIDAFGNVGETEIRTTDGQGQTFVKTIEQEYLNNESKWTLGRPDFTRVVHKHPDGSQITRSSDFEYYPDNGLLKIKTVEPDSKLALTTKYFYDAFGNKEIIEKTGLAEEGRVETRVSRIGWDERGINLVSQTNAQEHALTYAEHNLYGKPRLMTGPNGLSSGWEYDSVGRKTKETRADGTTTEWSLAWDESMPGAVYSLTTTVSGQAPKIQIFDKLGRVIRTITVGFEGETIHRDVEYDRFKRVARQSLPYFEGEEAKWIVFAYDSLDRQTEKRSPGSGNDSIVVQTQYEGLTTRYVDAKGKIKTVVKNAAGKIVRVTDPMGGVVRHQYNAAGALKKTIDAGGQVIDLDYDNRGNKISMKDPDMGNWEYSHNAFGKLIWQKDAKGQIVNIKYDVLGRMIERKELEGTTTWTYDQAERGVGKLFEVKGSGGYLRRYSYDELGRPSSTTVSAEGENHSVLTAYDDLGRVDFQAWPGDFRLYRRYNQHGFLSALQSPKKDNVDGFDKDELEERMNAAIAGAGEAQRMAWTNRVQKLRLDKKAETYRRIASLLKKRGTLVDTLRQASNSIQEYGKALGDEAKANETQAGQYYSQAEEIGQQLAMSGGSEAELHQNYIYHQQMTDMLAEMADAVMTYNDESFFTKDQYELAAHCVNQIQYHQKQALHFQAKAGDAALNGLDQIQMMVDDGGRWITYWRAGAYDAAGRLISEVNGNGLYTEKTYNPAGELTQILSRFGFEDPIRNLGYQYDEKHNLTVRHDRIQDVRESFVYDDLDRLKEIRGGDSEEESEDEAPEEESPGDIKQLSFSGRWSPSGGRNPHSASNPSFSFSLKTKSLVTIDLTSPHWVDTYLYLKDSSGRMIARDDDGGYWLFSKLSMVLEKGDYEIVAATYRWRAYGNFNIHLDSAKPPPVKIGNWERSGGRSPWHPGNPVIPIVVTENKPLQIDLMSSQDTYLFLMDSSRRVIRRNDDGGAGYNSRIRTTLAAGQYFIVAGTYWYGRSGQFQVMLGDAARFGVLNGQDGRWESSGGRNPNHPGNPVVPMAVEERTTVQIDLTSRQDAYLYLLNSERRVIARNDDGGAGYNSRLRLTLEAGQYYLVAATYWSGRVGDFQFFLNDGARFGTLGGGDGAATQSFDYDARGAMTSNSALDGEYQYDPSRPGAVVQAGENSYEYDANGNLTRKNGVGVGWTSFNKPSLFVSGDGSRSEFKHAPDRSRFLKLRRDSGGAEISRTFYMGKGYERTRHANGSETRKYFIRAGGRLISIHTVNKASSNAAATDRIRYLHYDNLGSVDTVTDGRGEIVERMSYQAFGKRREDEAPVWTKRGFTGHEHIDELGLIHMNGRVYDPEIGRFLSPDPHIQAPYNSQSYNRYSYVLNNPLKYTDPSGYFFKKISRAFHRGVNNAVKAVDRGYHTAIRQNPASWLKDSWKSGERHWKTGIHNYNQNAMNFTKWADKSSFASLCLC